MVVQVVHNCLTMRFGYFYDFAVWQYGPPHNWRSWDDYDVCTLAPAVELVTWGREQPARDEEEVPERAAVKAVLGAPDVRDVEASSVVPDCSKRAEWSRV